MGVFGPIWMYLGLINKLIKLYIEAPTRYTDG